MSQGRGSALVFVTVAVMAAMAVVLHSGTAEAAATTYTVGDAGGWTYNVATWPSRKRFKAGDTLVFKYSSGAHNVVKVDKAGYMGCTTPGGATVYQSGQDKIKLAKGQNFFICNFPGHCEGGMKIAITAA